MTIYLEEESEIRLPVDCRKVAEQVVEETLDYVNSLMKRRLRSCSRTMKRFER